MTISNKLYDAQNTLFNYIVFISYALYFVILFGLSTNAPQYLDTLQYCIKIYISLFLIIRFNYFTNVKFNELDKKIAFSAGVFLLTTTLISQITSIYTKYIPSSYKNKKISF